VEGIKKKNVEAEVWTEDLDLYDRRGEKVMALESNGQRIIYWTVQISNYILVCFIFYFNFFRKKNCSFS